MRKPTAGSVLVDGIELAGAIPRDIMAARVGRIPEDRHASLVLDLSVAVNLMLERVDDFLSGGRLDQRRIMEHAQDLIARYAIKARPEDRVGTLSGGNIQKVLLARVLSRDPRVIIVSQPTRGLDVGATEYVRTELLARRAAGAAILLVSEDLDELLALSDRLLVFYEGRIVGEVSATDADPERLGMLMAGRGSPHDRRRTATLATGIACGPRRLARRGVVGCWRCSSRSASSRRCSWLPGANPIEGYLPVPRRAPHHAVHLLEVLVTATPILLTGAAVAIAFRAGFWNIGAEGQLLAGAVAAAGIGTAGRRPAAVAGHPAHAGRRRARGGGVGARAGAAAGAPGHR